MATKKQPHKQREPKVWYEADRDLMGNGWHTCGHKHRTPEAAERCLPKPPRNNPSSSVQYFSMAEIREYHEG